MNPTQQNLMELILQSKLANNELFTAFDITLAIRASGVPVFHNEVREAIHDAYLNGGMGNLYIKTYHKLGNGESAFVFHPHTIGVYNYQIQPVTVNQPTNKNSQPANVVPAKITPTLVKTKRNSDPSSLTPDAWQRIRIPAQLTRQIGLKPYDYADISFDSKTGTIQVGKVGSNPSALQSNTVDQYGNIRIGLKQHNINATQFKTIPLPSKGLLQIIAD